MALEKLCWSYQFFLCQEKEYPLILAFAFACGLSNIIFS